VRQLKIAQDRLTARTENILRYFNEVDRKSIMKPDEEFKIGLLAQQGDEEAINKLVSANLRFVISVAKQYASTGALLEDLICQGNIGLCDAARTFDPSRGFKFISYAVWHIRKEILSYLNSDHRTVRIPTNVLNDLSKIRKIDESILQEKGRYGTLDEIHDESVRLGKELSISQISRVTQSNGKSIPLESDNPDEYGAPIEWLSGDLNPTKYTDESDLDQSTQFALSKLTDMQADIVTRILGLGGVEPESFSTVAKRYGKTSEWARICYRKAIRTMQVKLRRAKVTYESLSN
jgi:RNA polymerase primary sigma factor